MAPLGGPVRVFIGDVDVTESVKSINLKEPNLIDQKEPEEVFHFPDKIEFSATFKFELYYVGLLVWRNGRTQEPDWPGYSRQPILGEGVSFPVPRGAVIHSVAVFDGPGESAKLVRVRPIQKRPSITSI